MIWCVVHGLVVWIHIWAKVFGIVVDAMVSATDNACSVSANSISRYYVNSIDSKAGCVRSFSLADYLFEMVFQNGISVLILMRILLFLFVLVYDSVKIIHCNKTNRIYLIRLK